MTFTGESLHSHLRDAEEELRSQSRLWNEGEVPIDGETNLLYAAAREYERLASSGALLGAVAQSRKWFGEAGRLRHQRIDAGRLRRDIRERNVWEREPRVFSRALTDALLSRGRELISTVARDALAMDECYFDEFAGEYRDYPATFYAAKAKAALAVDDGDTTELIGKLDDAVARLEDPRGYWSTLPEYYRALAEGGRAVARTTAEKLFEYYEGKSSYPDEPREFVLRSMCGLLILADRRDTPVRIESERLPEALVGEPGPDDYVRVDVDPNIDVLEFSSSVGLFELERNDDGTPVIVGRIYHPGGAPVEAPDVPERAVGRVLSDEWIEAAIEEAEWRSHYDDEMVVAVRDAYEKGSLKRKLLVLQDRTGPHTFDESLATLSIDDVELRKGAGKR